MPDVVHLLVAADGREFTTGCGIKMLRTPAATQAVSGWSSQITCPACNARRRDLQP